MRLPLVLLLALVARADDPIESPPTSTPESTGTEAPGAPANPPTAAAPSAADVLAAATTLLVERRFVEALTVSIPAISDYPEHAKSFQAIAKIATDQLARASDNPSSPAPTSVGSATTPAATATSSGSATSSAAADPTRPAAPVGPGGAKPPASGDPSVGPAPAEPPPAPMVDTMAHRTRDERGGLQVGFDLGTPTGLRVEWKLKGMSVDGVGIRVSENFFIYDSGVFLNPELMFYADFIPATWQVEVSTGASFYYGSPYPMVGVAAQYDPPEPIQANIGLRVGRYLSLSPDIGVSFVW